MLAKIATDKDGKVTFIAWANPDYRHEGDALGNGVKVYAVSDSEYTSVPFDHAYFNNGHLTTDPTYNPPLFLNKMGQLLIRISHLYVPKYPNLQHLLPLRRLQNDFRLACRILC